MSDDFLHEAERLRRDHVGSFVVQDDEDAGEVRTDGGQRVLADTARVTELVQLGEADDHRCVIGGFLVGLVHRFEQTVDLVVEVDFDLVALEHG